jgi:zinc transport system substrate-binding protein
MQVKAIALTAALAAAMPALADAPKVATDIPPVHSLVARVMQGAGEPALILPPGASPHGHAMRPSEAAALADAEVVVWMGPALTPWLERAVDALSSGAASLELLDARGTLLLGYREAAAFGHRDHAGAEHGEHGIAQGDDDDRAHAGVDERVHAGIDPHAWLDPENAKLWLDAIAATLTEADPENAESYARNAAEGRAELDALMAELSETLGPVRERPFIVFHDAYHYFERRFGIEAAGAISLGDASSPSPARIAEVRETVRETVRGTGAACVFAEPQFPADLIETVVEGTEARAAVLDPVGAALAPGPALYPQLLRGLAGELRECLGQGQGA